MREASLPLSTLALRINPTYGGLKSHVAAAPVNKRPVNPDPHSSKGNFVTVLSLAQFDAESIVLRIMRMFRTT